MFSENDARACIVSTSHGPTTIPESLNIFYAICYTNAYLLLQQKSKRITTSLDLCLPLEKCLYIDPAGRFKLLFNNKMVPML